MAKGVGEAMAQSFIKFVEECIVWQYDVPQQLIMDNGFVMMFWEFVKFLNGHRIQHRPKTAFH